MEYQHCEFLALDRPLKKSEMAALRALSTRADITSTRFSNVYNYGDFKDSPATLMEKYLDAHVYIANWGTRTLRTLRNDFVNSGRSVAAAPR